MTKGTYDGTGAAIINGIKDLFKSSLPYGSADDTIDMTGKTCMVTGSNSGLGYATALRLARMGATVIMAVRSGIPKAGEKLKKMSGSSKIRMEYMDLSRLATVEELVLRIKKQGIHLDVLVCNAGVVSGKSRLTDDGFDSMFQVNYLANFFLVNRLIEERVIVPGTTKVNKPGPRIIFVSSETHRTGLPLDIPALGKQVSYTMKDSVTWYGYTKLLVTLFARELSRRFAAGKMQGLSVYTLCPGPVNTNIAREMPRIFHPLMKLVFLLFFRSPMKASDPVIFFASDTSITGMSDIYLHLMVKKEPDSRAADPGNGKALWQKSVSILEDSGFKISSQ
jgi:NAD(P)-dependent dehydrogenase (short-subunit alcohol dehydrogenase family)